MNDRELMGTPFWLFCQPIWWVARFQAAIKRTVVNIRSGVAK